MWNSYIQCAEIVSIGGSESRTEDGAEAALAEAEVGERAAVGEADRNHRMSKQNEESRKWVGGKGKKWARKFTVLNWYTNNELANKTTPR